MNQGFYHGLMSAVVASGGSGVSANIVVADDIIAVYVSVDMVVADNITIAHVRCWKQRCRRKRYLRQEYKTFHKRATWDFSQPRGNARNVGT